MLEWCTSLKENWLEKGGGRVFETILRKKVYILLFAFQFQQFSTMKKNVLTRKYFKDKKTGMINKNPFYLLNWKNSPFKWNIIKVLYVGSVQCFRVLSIIRIFLFLTKKVWSLKEVFSSKKFCINLIRITKTTHKGMVIPQSYPFYSLCLW